MGVTDVVLLAGIPALAGWILYRSFFKKQGACAGCTACHCGKNKTVGDSRSLSGRTIPKNMSAKNGDSPVRLTVAIVAVLGILLASSAYAGHPLVTDDAGTAGKGKGQVEIGTQIWHDRELVDKFTSQKNEGGETALTITLGLHNRVDLVIGLPYQWFTTYENGNRSVRADGIADIGTDLKWRFFEHNGWGLALKPGIILPTGDEERGLGNGRTVYRLCFISTREIAPWAFHLNLGYIRNENTAGDHRDLWHASLAAEVEILKDLKLVGNTGIERNPVPLRNTHPAFVLAGVTYALSERLSVDGGIKFGLNKPETDIGYLFGMTIRF